MGVLVGSVWRDEGLIRIANYFTSLYLQRNPHIVHHIFNFRCKCDDCAALYVLEARDLNEPL